jgi:hypothetical protein
MISLSLSLSSSSSMAKTRHHAPSWGQMRFWKRQKKMMPRISEPSKTDRRKDTVTCQVVVSVESCVSHADGWPKQTKSKRAFKPMTTNESDDDDLPTHTPHLLGYLAIDLFVVILVIQPNTALFTNTTTTIL